MSLVRPRMSQVRHNPIYGRKKTGPVEPELVIKWNTHMEITFDIGYVIHGKLVTCYKEM
jgi:hypothetical protein